MEDGKSVYSLHCRYSTGTFFRNKMFLLSGAHLQSDRAMSSEDVVGCVTPNVHGRETSSVSTILDFEAQPVVSEAPVRGRPVHKQTHSWTPADEMDFRGAGCGAVILDFGSQRILPASKGLLINSRTSASAERMRTRSSAGVVVNTEALDSGEHSRRWSTTDNNSSASTSRAFNGNEPTFNAAH